MRWFQEHRSTIIIIVVVLFLFLCIGATSQGRTQTTAVEGIARQITTPIERFLYSSSQYINKFYTFIVELPSLKRRNEELEKQLKENEVKLAEYDKLVHENEELMSLLEYKEENDKYDYLSASVVSIDPYEGFSTLILDKGSRDGVKEDMAVVLSEGLVGRITEVSSGTCKVLTVIDTTSMINGTSVKSKDYLRITGDKNSMLKGYADIDAKINKGDIIVTSGITGVFPKGIVIGKVEDVQEQQGNMEKLVSIDPSVDIEKVDKVLIIK